MEDLTKSYIKSFEIEDLWGYRSLHWENVHADVNILVGINGCGKTTLLNAIDAYYTDDFIKGFKGRPIGNPLQMGAYPIVYLRSFDTLIRDKRKAESPLMQELNNVIFQNKEGVSFFNYRMKMLDYPQRAKEIQENINVLFSVINGMFADTGKTIDISKGNNSTLVFHQADNIIGLEQLSSGEKQLLLILLKVFLLEGQPAIVLMDEPEVSLHIRWQREIIDRLLQLNPQCQLIIATHSPSIFGAGWGDKVVYMEEIIK